MRVEEATRDELPAVRAAYAHARVIQFYERQGFRVVGRRRIGVEPRLPPHHHGNEFTLLEETCAPTPSSPSS